MALLSTLHSKGAVERRKIYQINRVFQALIKVSLSMDLPLYELDYLSAPSAPGGASLDWKGGLLPSAVWTSIIKIIFLDIIIIAPFSPHHIFPSFTELWACLTGRDTVNAQQGCPERFNHWKQSWSLIQDTHYNPLWLDYTRFLMCVCIQCIQCVCIRCRIGAGLWGGMPFGRYTCLPKLIGSTTTTIGSCSLTWTIVSADTILNTFYYADLT